MPAPSPSISVVMPVYNAAAYLGPALASIAAQTVPVTEVIVVDDGSADGSAAVATAHPLVTVIRQPNQGAAIAINRGVAAATGDYLAFLDADDLWAPEKLAKQLAVLEGPRRPDLAFGFAQNFHSPDLTAELRQRIHCPPEPMPGMVLGTMLLRRADFARIGPLQPDWKIGYFIEWYARAQDLGLVSAVLPDILLHRRLHADNLSRRELAARPDFARILKFVLDRRRQKKPTIDLL
jgi:glycosyltransferase involved in cell wall biosynthesis